MLDQINDILKTQNILSHRNHGITVGRVENSLKGIELAVKVLYAVADKKTILYLSGGRTPRDLYMRLAKEEELLPAAVGMVDERFGPKFHVNSNEKMIKDTGFLRYLHMRDIPFYPILSGSQDRKETARVYDEKFRSLLTIFPKHIGVMGIGSDGHTSSIIPNRKEFRNPMFDASQKDLLVSDFDDQKSSYHERIGMTFLGLSMLDLLLILVFGSDKLQALEQVFTDGSETHIPARFYKREEIAKKTLLITDQKV